MAKVTLQYSTAAFRLPPELEQRLKELALPPDVARQFRELLALPRSGLGLRFPTEWNIPDEFVQAVAQAAAEQPTTLQAGPPAAVTERTPTKVWYADWRKRNPKHKGETDTGYAKRIYDAMQQAPVTTFWSEPTCLRRLYLDRDGSDLSGVVSKSQL